MKDYRYIHELQESLNLGSSPQLDSFDESDADEEHEGDDEILAPQRAFFYMHKWHPTNGSNN